MKTTAIIGSPRRNGNCDILVESLLERIDGEKKSFFLNKLDIGFCNACLVCEKGDCIKDDDARIIIDEMQKSDLIIFSSPIYYGQITAQAKTVIDRFYQVTRNPDKTLEGKKVILIITQANPYDTYDQYIEDMKTMAFGHLGMEVIHTVYAKGASEKGEGISDALKIIEELKI